MPNIFAHHKDNNKSKTFLQCSSPTFLNVSKKILARQSIFRSIDCNIEDNLIKAPTFLTQQQVKMSSIYEKMIQRIDKIHWRQEQQKIQHQRRMRQLQKTISDTRASTQSDKMQIWQVKNQLMQLEQVYDEDMEEYHEIWQMVQAENQQHGERQEDNDQEEQGDLYEYGGEEDSGNMENEEGEGNQNNVSEERENYSKPTCSIKYMISNRSITTPNLSKLQIHSGQRVCFTGDISERASPYTSQIN